MENKYKERAIELLKTQFPRENKDGSNFKLMLEAMCSLAEEVEETLLYMNQKLLQAKYPNRYFTKEQIEEAIKICTDKDYEAWILVQSFREVLYEGIINKKDLNID